MTANGMKGNSFDTPQLGIRAQVQHLKAYASTDALKNACIDPRFKYVTRGCAEYVEWLGQKENPDGKGWAAGAGYGEKILSILKGILGTAGGTPKPAPAETEAWYRVRKSWADASSQKGAFKSLENAKKCADENPGCNAALTTARLGNIRESALSRLWRRQTAKVHPPSGDC